MNNSPFPRMDNWLKTWFKRSLTKEDAFLHYAYTLTIIGMLNESKIYTLIPDIMKVRIVKLIAIYISGSDLIKLAIKKKGESNEGFKS